MNRIVGVKGSRRGLYVLGLALIGLVVFFTACQQQAQSTYKPQNREYMMVAGEWDTTLSKEVSDRGVPRAAQQKLERYTFDPGTIVAYKGDTLVLRIHGVKGDEHDIDIPDFPNFAVYEEANINLETGRGAKGKKLADPKLLRGQQVIVEVTADKAGIFQMVCTVHGGAYFTKDEPKLNKKKGDLQSGPMVAQIVVLEPPR